MNRRLFLGSSLGAGAAAFSSMHPFSSAFAGKESAVDRFVVVFYVSGGWDTTLSADPWTDPVRPLPTDLFLEYRDDEVLKTGGVSLGPAMSSMQPFAKEMAVVNGVFMNISDNGHPASQLYMLTGDPSLNAASMEVELNRAIRSGPYGVLTNEVIRLGGRAETITSIEELIAIAEGENPLDQMRAIISALGNGSAVSAGSDLIEAVRIIAGASSQHADLVQRLLAEKASGAVSESAAVRAAFLSGCISVAHLNVDRQVNLDTHAGHEGVHLAAQKGVWEKIAAILKMFKDTQFRLTGESLFDRTTFLVVSEFSRTAALNASKGKDHNPLTNSVVFVGRGVSGGQTVGRSKVVSASDSINGTPYQIALPFDFTAQVAATSENVKTFITPTTIVRTLAEICQVDWGAFQSVPSATSPLSVIVKR